VITKIQLLPIVINGLFIYLFSVAQPFMVEY